MGVFVTALRLLCDLSRSEQLRTDHRPVFGDGRRERSSTSPHRGLQTGQNERLKH